MSSALPEIVDPWRMVSARRIFQGRLPLSALPRLATSLATTEGEVDYELDFGKDEFGVSGVHVRATTALPLTCQRSLETFNFPVSIDTRLGFIVDEADEAALPGGYEPLLLDAAGLRPADVIEDELILAVPIVPVKPGTREMQREWKDEGAAEDEPKPNPFAALKKAKFNK
ncbi:MAG TPA: YceD family protein [Rudaea sp.]|uniref:YceD family protein n=1 Tax=Rudaea sp. TaxID=2136325 RepID=UPI002F9209FE